MGKAAIDAYFVCGGRYHDIDYARLQLLALLAEQPRVRTRMAEDYRDIAAIEAADFLVTYTVDVLPDEETARLYEAIRATLRDWIERLRKDARDKFPEKVTAFRKDMAVHGKFGQPCPVCGTPVQRIVHAENETNYCARCQTGGKLLADRALSRLLHEDWPRTVEALEERRRGRDLDPAERG